MRKLPPLTTLKSFEAASRHLSFSRAADELHVTHGAVSRAIATLEDYLQVKLFDRHVRAVTLTPSGTSYFLAVRDVLDKLAVATGQILDQQSTGIVNVSTLDSFAAKWLLPRLFRFAERHRDIDVRLSTSDSLANFTTDGIELVIRYGRGNYPGLKTELLMKEELTPVCSPALLAKGPPLNTLSDLRHYTLIHDQFPIDWVSWLKFAGVTDVDARRGLRLERSAFAVAAAVEGHGVILGRSALVADDIKAGRLVKPFALNLPTDLAYYVVTTPASIQRPKVKAFRDWLFEEVAKNDGD
jgi:LysR family glycine cleavage system transcriptional activator